LSSTLKIFKSEFFVPATNRTLFYVLADVIKPFASIMLECYFTDEHFQTSLMFVGQSAATHKSQLQTSIFG
jgi:hypothetical protein